MEYRGPEFQRGLGNTAIAYFISQKVLVAVARHSAGSILDSSDYRDGYGRSEPKAHGDTVSIRLRATALAHLGLYDPIHQFCIEPP